MPKIIFNYKICDKAEACGGISECPVGAITYDTVYKKPVWDQKKCTFCLKCTLPDSCPVGAILYAKDFSQEKSIIDSIKSDPRSEEWLWFERYGVQPSVTNPLAIDLTPINFKSIINSTKPILIDIWHEDYLECRLHSPLFVDLLDSLPAIKLYKLDAKKYPELADSIKITTYPSLVVYKLSKKVFNYPGHIVESNVKKINSQLKKLLIKSK